MILQSVPRTTTRLGLSALRLPLTTAERVLGRADDETWPPTVAFEGFEASVKHVVGSLLRDEELIDEGRLGQAKVAELRDAIRLETVAEQKRAKADADLEERLETDEERREQVARRARARKDDAKNRRNQAKQKTDAATRAEKQRVERLQAEREAAFEKEERAARLEAIDEEREAVEAEREAADAQADVIDVDKALHAVKSARKQRSAS